MFIKLHVTFIIIKFNNYLYKVSILGKLLNNYMLLDTSGIFMGGGVGSFHN